MSRQCHGSTDEATTDQYALTFSGHIRLSWYVIEKDQ